VIALPLYLYLISFLSLKQLDTSQSRKKVVELQTFSVTTLVAEDFSFPFDAFSKLVLFRLKSGFFCFDDFCCILNLVEKAGKGQCLLALVTGGR
jgi:hypothetical protein